MSTNISERNLLDPSSWYPEHCHIHKSLALDPSPNSALQPTSSVPSSLSSTLIPYYFKYNTPSNLRCIQFLSEDFRENIKNMYLI
jgi:hypothetical protein